jgi:hypothetical protein
MADHFYSFTDRGSVFSYDRSQIVVGTSTAGGSVMELRVTDGAVTKEQLYMFLEQFADLVAASDTIFTLNTPFTA